MRGCCDFRRNRWKQGNWQSWLELAATNGRNYLKPHPEKSKDIMRNDAEMIPNKGTKIIQISSKLVPKLIPNQWEIEFASRMRFWCVPGCPGRGQKTEFWYILVPLGGFLVPLWDQRGPKGSQSSISGGAGDPQNRWKINKNEGREKTWNSLPKCDDFWSISVGSEPRNTLAG